MGTITFDGQILELLGFGEESSKRIDVGQVQEIGLGPAGPFGEMFFVDVGPASGALKVAIKLSDKDRADLGTLIEEVRVAGGESK